MYKYFIGALFGVLTGVASVALYLRIINSENMYYVARVVSHHAKELDNSEATFLVYIKGKQGHVRKIICLFPSGLKLPGGPYSRFGGIPVDELKLPENPLFKIAVGEVAQKYLFNENGYFCELAH